MDNIIHGCYDCKYHGRCPYHDSCTGPDTRKSKWELKEENIPDVKKEERYSIELNGNDLCIVRQRLIDAHAEIKGIKKIMDYCSNWTDRLEMELRDTDDIWRRGMDVIEEEFFIIDEMMKYCQKRIDELNDELNDIRGQLSRYNHGDYTDTAKRITEERIKRDFEEGGE